MKKIVAIFLCFCMVLALGACGAQEEATSSPNTQPNKEELTISLELAKQLLEEGKDNEAYQMFKKLSDSEAAVYLKCFDQQQSETSSVYYSDGAVLSKKENGFCTYLSTDIGTFEAEIEYDEHGKAFYKNKKITGDITEMRLAGMGIYSTVYGKFPDKYEYDAAGRVIKETYDGLYKSDDYTTYEYDKKGNRVAKTIHTEALDKFRNVKTVYEYDEKGRKIIENEYASTGDIESGKIEWERYSKNEYKYDENDRLISQVEYSDGKTISQIKYEYDDEGNLCFERKLSEGGKQIDETKYDKYGRTVYEIVSLGSEYESKEEYEYDDKGNLIHSVQYRKGDKVGELKCVYNGTDLLSRTEETFGENAGKNVLEYKNGVRCKEISYGSDGKVSSEREYDEHGNLIHKGSIDSVTGLELSANYYKYEYDKKGNLVSQSLYKGSDDRLLNKIIFTYNTQNLLTGKTETSYKSGKETDKIEYKYDGNGNITQQTEYSNGKEYREMKYSYTAVYNPSILAKTVG